MPDAFDAGVANWIGVLGQLREVVRSAVVAEQLDDVIAGRSGLRVLDVGCGQGSQALLLARAGHDVTGLDPSEELLAVFETALADEPADIRSRVRLVVGTGERAAELTPGLFDLILCHGVLMYLADPMPLLSALSAVAGSGATLSLLVRNGVALAMRPGLLGDWPTAMAAFGSTEYANRLGLSARAHTPAEVDALLEPLGWAPEPWYGVRVFTDHLEGEVRAPAEMGELVAAEREAGRRDPYRSVAALLHLVYAKNLGEGRGLG